MAESFVIYRSFHEALKDLPPEQYGRVMFAINEYALNGTEPELTGCEKAFFMLMRPQIDANTKRRENGMNGGRPLKQKPTVSENTQKQKPMVFENEPEQKPTVIENSGFEKPNVNANENENVNANDNANENANANSGVSEETPGGSGGTPASAPDTPTPVPEKGTLSEPFPVHESPPEKPKSSPRFIKPTVEEIREYCAERQNHLDAQSFFDFYESKGWMIGKDKMKDWRACIRTWEQRRKGEQSGGRTRPGGMWGSENAAADSYIDLM